MAIPPANFDWKQYYTTVSIEHATESTDMAINIKELEAITREVYNNAALSAIMLPEVPEYDNELIPTDYDEQKAYFKRKRAGKKKHRGQSLPQMLDNDRRILDAIAGKFEDRPIPEAPDQSLTAGYIQMMDNEGSDGDNWNKALEILYPENGDTDD
jgi:hypothetical protein